MKHISRGFTLVELLVVISIIGILSVIIFANFSDARIDAKNKAFRTAMKETQLALQVYKAQNDQYPANLNALVPEFISVLPTASKAANTACSINYYQNTSTFKLTGVNCIGGASTAAEGVQSDDAFARCPDYCGSCAGGLVQTDPAFYQSVAVYSAGAECN